MAAQRPRLKRALDVAVALAGLVLSSPVLLVVALAVRLTSRGPALYHQERVGRRGARFRLHKFRTMRVGADLESRLTPGNDARVTRIGRFLRRSNLDELPQLWNVLVGDMSLVGPRPEVPEFVDLADPRWIETLSVRPGMTAPVTLLYRDEGAILSAFADPAEGYRRDVLPRKLELNAEYVRTWTVAGDLLTLVKTVLGARGDPRPERAQRRSIAGIRVTPARRFLFFLALDAILLAAAFASAFLLRFDGAAPREVWPAFGVAMPVFVATCLGSMLAVRAYHAAWSFYGLRDLARVAAAIAVATGVTVAAVTVAHDSVFRGMPRSLVLIAAPLSFLSIAAFRLSKRAALTVLAPARTNAQRTATLVVGAGDAGAQVVRSLVEGPASASHEVVGILDDDPLARGTSIYGARVLGPVSSLRENARLTRAGQVIICVPDATREFVRDVLETARESGITQVRIVPPLGQVVGSNFSFAATRAVSLEDLLGRETVRIDAGSLRSLIEGRRVLVTGGAGSIGSELCRQISRLSPALLTILDNDETRLFETGEELKTAPCPIALALVDIRDARALREAFAQGPHHVVFHAAAFKHVPMMEANPIAALHVNVLGTMNVVQAAEASGTQRFVLISTDKAVNPSSVMGASKRAAEVAIFSRDRDKERMVISAVRFGNVIGSRGSVIPIFERQLDAGGPLTVTHPDMERYFMMISEAVTLVLQSAALGVGGALYVLDMGKPVRIMDVAREFIRLKGLEPDRDVKIVISGLRPGEKLREQLVYDTERLAPTLHPRILRVDASGAHGAIDLSRVRDIVEVGDVDDARGLLASMFPTLDPPTGRIVADLTPTEVRRR